MRREQGGHRTAAGTGLPALTVSVPINLALPMCQVGIPPCVSLHVNFIITLGGKILVSIPFFVWVN